MDTIALRNVRKEFPGVTALDGVSFSVKKGTVHGFLGPNGAGKSTSMKIICGLLPPTSGKVEVQGERIGFLPETPPLYPNMRVGEYLKFVAAINGVPKSEIEQSKVEVVQKCQLNSVEKRFVGNLSKGFKQRVGIAAALIHKPEILIFDEPTVGLDPKAIVEIRDLISSLKENHTILLSTHILHEVTLLCDEITIIHKGKIINTGKMEDIQKTFQTTQVIRAEVTGWTDELTSKIQERSFVSSLEVDRKNEKFELRFFSSEDSDIREKISSFLLENKCGILSFAEEKMNLEDIFQEATQEDRG